MLFFITHKYSVFCKLNRYRFWSTLFVSLIVVSCGSDDPVDVPDIDTDGDGIYDQQEIANGTKKNNPCDPVQNSTYTGYDLTNLTWLSSDCDTDGTTNEDELTNGTNPYLNEESDLDGDGIVDYLEDENGTDRLNPCDPVQIIGYTGYDSTKFIWSDADCDGDGVKNGQEVTNNTDPYLDDTDSDGDGISDYQEIADNTDKDNPCDPAQNVGYVGYTMSNVFWLAADCDGDGVLNSEELLNNTDPYFDDTVFAVPQFLSNLSQLHVFKGNLADLEYYSTTFEYALSTPLFTDYSYKLRSISLPQGTQLSYNGEGLLQFPDNTVITKTFYYYDNELNPSIGKKIIETRVAIKLNGVWTLGNYIWNSQQNDAVLDQASHTVLVNWIDLNGVNKSVNYETPAMVDCIKCHSVNGTIIPIGPKARALNFMHNGSNQLQVLIDGNLLSGAPDISQIEILPDWSDQSLTLDDRARSYLDVNCAHCHQPGGMHDSSIPNRVDFRFETIFANTRIYETRYDIQGRVTTQISGYAMPLIGTRLIHAEGAKLIEDYINSL